MQAPITPTGTLAKNNLVMWLHCINEDQAAEDVLERLRARKSASAGEKKALWAGCWALLKDIRDDAEKIRQLGGLLHFGCVRTRSDDGEHYLLGGVHA